MNIDLWKNFVNSGSVVDYLKYKEYQNKRTEFENANDNQGFDYKRTDDRRE